MNTPWPALQIVIVMLKAQVSVTASSALLHFSPPFEARTLLSSCHSQLEWLLFVNLQRFKKGHSSQQAKYKGLLSLQLLGRSSINEVSLHLE